MDEDQNANSFIYRLLTDISDLWSDDRFRDHFRFHKCFTSVLFAFLKNLSHIMINWAVNEDYSISFNQSSAPHITSVSWIWCETISIHEERQKVVGRPDRVQIG